MHPVEHPTYLADIRFLFTDRDMRCMGNAGIDLRTYEGVKFNADRIYFNVREGSMPPPHLKRRWSKKKAETFYNWMRDGFPRGFAPQNRDLPVSASAVGRLRRNLADFDKNSEELDLLVRAFEGILKLDEDDPDNPNAYFNVAGVHWLPEPLYCRHHENAYNPWHRAYLLKFENALRSIDGCKDVTLPYWDIESDEIPSVLFDPPFDKYTFPSAVRAPNGALSAAKGDTTQRFEKQEIIERIQQYRVRENIVEALSATRWEDFNGWAGADPWITFPDGTRYPDHKAIILAHDGGHAACGPTMRSPNLAAFDPLFWFFHCNWDRLWWRWQQLYSGTTLADFKTLLDGDAYWLTDPVVNGLDPFGVRADEMIDSRELDVEYAHPPKELIPDASEPLIAAARSSEGIRVVDEDRVLVTVAGIDRLEIPGSFEIVLLADEQPVRRNALFQSTTPKLCPTCRKQGEFAITFEVDRSEILDRKLSAALNLYGDDGSVSPFPLSQAGDPKILVRIKLAA
ncbi:tyrosinase family protein [Hoeflea poritis]|uniref:Tyrosinase family protein n=1 Tax=Hoeflea poritis TaxID=2993659 RepID=A0ABT4VMH7_9HYPH|nr:tyrosinase family protein [Hoeflea poritis]MDA4845258.1 tyrosinase family protein [Hoeflea poritis]